MNSTGRTLFPLLFLHSTLALVTLHSANRSEAADWPNWRGPACSGAATDCGEELVEDISQAKRVWSSEEPTKPCFGGKGVTWGYSDFAIVDDRVYMAYGEGSGPIATNNFLLMKKLWTKGSGHLRGGKTPEEAARMANICAKVRGDDGMICLDANTGRTLWKTIFKEHGVNHQFIRSPAQYSYQATPCVGTIDDNGEKRNIVILFGTSLRVYGLDAATGEPLWESDAGPLALKFSMQFMDVCFRPGRQDWKSKDRNPEEGLSYDSCPTIADGVVGINGHDRGNGAALVGLDLATGRRLWSVPMALDRYASPLRWVYQAGPDDPNAGKEYFICHTGGSRGGKINGKVAPGILTCIEAKTGKVMWRLDRHNVPGDPIQSPSIYSNLVVCCGGPKDLEEHETKGSDHATIQCYRMTPEKAELVWQWKEMKGFREGGWRVMRFTSPVIHRGYVYVASSRMFDLKTGELVDKKVGVGKYAPIATDGYLVGSGESIRYRRFAPNAKNSTLSNNDQLGEAIANEDGGPAIAGGRLFIRGDSRIHCVDLRKSYCENAAPPIDPPKDKPDGTPGGSESLRSRHFTDRQRAVEALGKAADIDAAAVANLAVEGDWYARKAASELLQIRGTKASAVAPQLAAALPAAVKDGTYGQVRLLVETINAIDAGVLKGVTEEIADALEDEDAMVAYRACAALESMGPAGSAAVPQLVTVLERDDAYLYGRAALALKAMGPEAKAAAPALATTVQDSTHGEKVAYALDALRSIGPPEDAMPKLIALAAEKDWTPDTYKPAMQVDYDFFPEIAAPLIPWLAGECLKAMGPSVIPPLTAVIKEARETKRSCARWIPFAVLGHFGSQAKEALPELERFLKERAPKGADHGWCHIQLLKIRGESFQYVSLGNYAGATLVPLGVGDKELVAALRGDQLGQWGPAARDICRRDAKTRAEGFIALAEQVASKKKNYSQLAVKLIGEHAAKCDDDAARKKAIAALAALVDPATEKERLLPVVAALGNFGKDGKPAVKALEGHLTADAEVEKAIETALVKIRGKAKPGAAVSGDDLLPTLD